MPRIPELTALASADDNDLLVILDDPGSTSVTKKITVGNLKSSVISKSRYLRPYHTGLAANSQTATAGRVLLLTLENLIECTIDGVVIINAATVNGNVTVGIYGPVGLTTDTCAGASLLVESSSIALSGANTAQVITFTETALAKGKYYIAVEFSSNTHTYMRQTNQTQVVGWVQFYDRSGGYGALTNPCPAVTDTGSTAPGAVVRVSA